MMEPIELKAIREWVDTPDCTDKTEITWMLEHIDTVAPEQEALVEALRDLLEVVESELADWSIDGDRLPWVVKARAALAAADRGGSK